MTLANLSLTKSDERQARNARWLITGLFVVSAIATAISIVSFVMGTEGPTILGLSFGATAFLGIALVLCLRGQTIPGVGLTLSIVWLALLANTLISAGIGVALAVIGISVSIFLAGQAVPNRMAGRVILIGAAMAVVVVLLDLFGPAGRPLDLSQTTITLAAGILLAISVIFVIRDYGNYGLRTKLIATFVGLAVLSAGAISILTDNILRASLTEESGINLHNVAVNQAQDVGNSLASETGGLLSLGLSWNLDERLQIANAPYSRGDPAVIQASLENTDERWRALYAAQDYDAPLIWAKLNDSTVRELTRFQESFPQHVEVFYTDLAGGLVATTRPTSDFYQGDEEWWQAAYNDGQGALYIGQPALDESTGTYSVNIAVPIRSRLDETIVFGILRTTVDMESIRQALALPAGGQAAGVDLIFPDGGFFSGEAAGEEPPNPAIVAQLRANMEQYLTMTFEGEQSVVSVAPVTTRNPDTAVGQAVDGIGWVAVAHQSQQAAFAPVTAISRTIILVGLGVILIAALLGFSVAELLSRPILRLTGTAEKVAAGDLTAQAPVESEDEIGVLARTFNATTGRLRDTIGSLEQRVSDRTRAITLSAEVSQRLSGILDQQQLISEVVEQIRSAFNYYHVHIYLYDDKRTHLLLAGGTGDAARAMLARGHRLEEGRGLVGRAASGGAAVLVPDVKKDPAWLPNPLLPETRSELAVPIALGTRVLGVLDVQHSLVDGLAIEDQQIIQSIANQVAVALQNTRSFTQTQKQAVRETFVNTVGQKIQRATTIDDVLKIATQELGRALGAQRASAHVSSARLVIGDQEK